MIKNKSITVILKYIAILIGLQFVAVALAVLISCLFFLSDPPDEYYKGADWRYSEENFATEYIPYFEERLKYWFDEYGLSRDGELKVSDSSNLREYYFYSDIYTLHFYLRTGTPGSDGLSSGDCTFMLLFFETENSDIYDYSQQKKLVDFLNSITSELAYDAVTQGNEFERLYDLCVEKRPSQYESCSYSNIVYDAPYSPDVKYEVSTSDVGWSGLYKMQGDRDIDIKCNKFLFSGLLNPKP